MMDTATPPPAAHPHPPAGGRSDGPQAGAPGSDRRGAGGAKRVMPPHRGTRMSSPGATAPRACRLRVGIAVKWPLADDAGCTAHSKMVRPPPTAALQSMYAAPSARRASRLRAPAVAATDRGPRAPERVACGGMRVARYGNPTPPTSAIR